MLETIILGVVQGLTEFIPVSSSGHLVVLRDILNIEAEDPLAVDAVLQLASGLAILAYFGREWGEILRDRLLILAIALGTIPAVAFGLLLEETMSTVFRSSTLVAITLLVGALLMYLAERSATGDKAVTPRRGLLIGLFQALALVPGISRSGATISGGLFLGLSRERAARFSFLLALPIILGSGLKKLLDLSSAGALSSVGTELLVGSLFAFVFGFLAIRFLIRYLRTHKLTPFIWYRVVLALVILVLV